MDTLPMSIKREEFPRIFGSCVVTTLAFCLFSNVSTRIIGMSLMVLLLCTDFVIVCRSPQYAELGQSGFIHCNLPSDSAIFWRYKISEPSDPPIMTFTNFQKGGAGYESQEFDILLNGSLVIKNVSVYHETSFEVIFIDESDNSNSYTVSLIVTATPNISSSIIKECLGVEPCLIQSGFGMLHCEVAHSRPPTVLSWFKCNSDGSETYLNTTQDVIQDGLGTFRTVSQLHPTTFSNTLSIYYCRAAFPPFELFHQTKAFVDCSSEEINTYRPKEVNKKINSKAILSCSRRDRKKPYVWKKTTHGLFEIIAYRFPGSKDFVKTKDYVLNEFGELIINIITTQHEGTYICLTTVIQSDIAVYELFAVVVPSTNPQVIVEECLSIVSDDCSLASRGSGELLCSVHDVRPAVSLKWVKDVNDAGLELIQGMEHLTEQGDLYTVQLMVRYVISTAEECKRNFSVKCVATGQAANYFSSNVAKVTMSHGQVECKDTLPTTASGSHNEAVPYFLIILVMAVMIAVIVSVVVVVVGCTGHCRTLRSRDRSALRRSMELLPLRESQSSANRGNCKTKRSRLLHHIKVIVESQLSENERYIMNSISDLKLERNLPFLKNRVTLRPCKYIFRHNVFSRKRRVIIQGDAGCGKTTFAKRMAREWINEEVDSPMSEVGILLLLSLAEFKIRTTIPEGVITQLIAEDSMEEFSLSEIEHILKEEHKVVVFLDDFDVFLERTEGEYKQSHLFRLLSNELPNNYHIILLTRTLLSYTDLDLPIVMLHPFTDEEMNAFIHSYVFRANEIDFLQYKLKENIDILEFYRLPFFLKMVVDIYLSNYSLTLPTSRITTTFATLLNELLRQVKEGNLTSYEPSPKVAEFAFRSVSAGENIWNMSRLIAEYGEEILLLLKLTFFKKIQLSTAVTHTALYENTLLQFSHDVFRFYLGAHFLSHLESTEEMLRLLSELNVSKCQHLIIFTCGLNSTLVPYIIEHLKNLEDTYPCHIRNLVAHCSAEVNSN